MVWVTQDDISEPQKLAENDQNRPKFPKSGEKISISLRKREKCCSGKLRNLKNKTKTKRFQKFETIERKKNHFQSILSFFFFSSIVFSKKAANSKKQWKQKKKTIFSNQSDSVSKIFAKFFKKFWREFFFLRKMLEHSRYRVSWHNIELLEYLFPWLS